MKKAFTLLETLFSLGLMLLLLGIFATALQGYYGMLRGSEQRDQAVLQGTESLQRVAREIEQATTLVRPTSDVSWPEVIFIHDDLQVSVRVENGELRRGLLFNDGRREEYTLLRDVRGFSFHPQGARFHLKLAFATRTLEFDGVFRCR